MDAIDQAIVDLLRRNARAGFGEIGAQVGLSASAVKRRVDRLTETGTIRSFTVHVDPHVEGLGTEAYIEVFCRGTVSPADLRRILSAEPAVVSAATVSGDADAIVHIRSTGVGALEEALERIRAAPQVDHTRSAIVLSRLVTREVT